MQTQKQQQQILDLTFCEKCKANSVRNDNVQGIAVCSICRQIKFQHLINTEDEVRFKDQEDEQDSGKNLSRYSQLQYHPVYGIIEDIIQTKGDRRKFYQSKTALHKEIDKVLEMEKKIRKVLKNLTDKDAQSAIVQFHQIILSVKKFKKEQDQLKKKKADTILYPDLDIQCDAAIAVCMAFMKLFEGNENLRKNVLRTKVQRKFKIPSKKFQERYQFLQDQMSELKSSEVQTGLTELVSTIEGSSFFKSYQVEQKDEYLEDKAIFGIIYNQLRQHNNITFTHSKNMTQAGIILIYFQKCMDPNQLENKSIYKNFNLLDISELINIKSSTLEKKYKELEENTRMEPLIKEQIYKFLDKVPTSKYM